MDVFDSGHPFTNTVPRQKDVDKGRGVGKVLTKKGEEREGRGES